VITRAAVADLREGDVVELRHPGWQGAVVTGPVYLGGGGLWVASHRLVGGPWASLLQVTVVSRAPRPLYVNHPRTEPVAGDVVRDADNDEWNGWLYLRSNNGRWLDSSRGEWFEKAMPARLRLLVDGETGQVVQ
jgi:hypothetical protein